jgi:hypothetical protein
MRSGGWRSSPTRVSWAEAIYARAVGRRGPLAARPALPASVPDLPVYSAPRRRGPVIAKVSPVVSGARSISLWKSIERSRQIKVLDASILATMKNGTAWTTSYCAS